MLNKVIMAGHLGRDPEVRHTSTDKVVANFSLTTTEKGKDDNTYDSWHRVVAWGKLAERVGTELCKGSVVYVEGRLSTRSWEKDGEKRYVTEVTIHRFTRLGGAQPAQQDGKVDDDIPFALILLPAFQLLLQWV